MGIDLQAAGPSTCLRGGDERGAAATEGVEHQIATVGAVLYGICDQVQGLNRGMAGELLQAAGPEAIDAVVAPKVRAKLLIAPWLHMLR